VKGEEWYQADAVAQEYDDKRFSGGGRLIDRREKEAVLSALGPVEDRRILEVACGTGRFTTMLADQGADVVGLDVSAEMMSQGRAKARGAGVTDRLEFMRGDAGRLPFPDDRFDAVLAMRFFHLMDEPTPFVRELRRVATGQVVFDTFNRASARRLYTRLLPMGSRLYSRSEVESLLAAGGLRLAGESHDFVLPFGFYRGLPGRVARPFRRLDELLGRTPVGDALASVSYWDARVPEA
jgi:ubiquinone/menaquinone biosynthesis C-methylase UbiE